MVNLSMHLSILHPRVIQHSLLLCFTPQMQEYTLDWLPVTISVLQVEPLQQPRFPLQA